MAKVSITYGFSGLSQPNLQKSYLGTMLLLCLICFLALKTSELLIFDNFNIS